MYHKQGGVERGRGAPLLVSPVTGGCDVVWLKWDSFLDNVYPILYRRTRVPHIRRKAANVLRHPAGNGRPGTDLSVGECNGIPKRDSRFCFLSR